MSDEATVEVTGAVGAGPSELDSAAGDFIKQMEAEYRAEDLKAPEADPAVAGDAAAVPPAESPKPADPASPGPELTAAGAPGADIQAAIAKAVVEALAAAKAASRAEKEARKAAEATRPTDPSDEIEALQRLGYDPDMIVKRVLAKKLGDKAPKELLDSIRDYERERNYRNLENRVVTKEREIAARNYFDSVDKGAKDYIKAGAYGKDAPTVAEVARRDPDRVHAEVMQEVISDARTRMQRDPNGAIMTYAEAVARVETRWAEMRRLFTTEPAPAGASTTQTTPTQAAEPKPKTGATKPPDRPLAPWLRKADIEQEGIKAAMDEFRRAESANLKKA